MLLLLVCLVQCFWHAQSHHYHWCTKFWGHTLKCVALLWWELMGRSQIEVPSFLEIPLKACLGWVQLAPHRTVLQESDPPPCCSHFEYENDLKNGTKLSDFGKIVWTRILANNTVEKMSAACQLEALEKVKILHSTPCWERKKILSQLAHCQSISGQYLDHLLNKLVCLSINIVAYVKYQQQIKESNHQSTMYVCRNILMHKENCGGMCIKLRP